MPPYAAVDTGPGRRTGPRVLIVDDDSAARRLLAELVRTVAGDCLITEAADGDAALALIRTDRPDLALVDLMLPDSRVSGVLVCQELCKESRTMVIIVTGMTSRAVVDTCLDMGAHSYLRKPFTSAELRSQLEECLTPRVPAGHV
jgi:DNA-binding response OmpR family regulator